MRLRYVKKVSSMFRIELISTYEGFVKNKDRWEDLFSRSGTDNVFLTYDWVDACIRHFYKGERLMILNVFKDERSIAIAPLVLRNTRYFGLPVKVISFIGTLISDRMDFILDSDKEKSIALILDYLTSIRSDWDFIDLQEMLEDTGTVALVKAGLSERKMLNIIGPLTKSFFVGFNGNGKDICKKFSKKLNIGLRKIRSRTGNPEIRFERYVNSAITKDDLFSSLSIIEGSSWKGEKSSGIFSRQDIRGFHKEIFHTFSNKKQLDISVLSIDKKQVAYLYNYLYKNRSYNYSIAFDKEYSELSPGTALLSWALDDSPERGIEEFDFTRGEGEWKTRFTRDFKAHNRIRIFKRSLYCWFLYFLQSKFMPYMKERKYLHRKWMDIKEKMKWV